MEAAMLSDPTPAAALTHTRWLADLEPVALEATRSAAIACRRWVGRGHADAADDAAAEAMRTALAGARGLGTVVVGEGAKDEAPMLFVGEQLGSGDGPSFDIAVDPLECTKLCAKGLPGALTTIAFAEPGAMVSIAASFYMDKLIGPAAACGALDLASAPEVNLERLSVALGKEVRELRVVVLDKPRHENLIGRLHGAGARVISPPDGDVAGALAALLPTGGRRPADRRRRYAGGDHVRVCGPGARWVHAGSARPAAARRGAGRRGRRPEHGAHLRPRRAGCR
jgi:fructose-1,6-bisphosphatase II